MEFVQGSFIKDNALVTVVGSNNGYKYHYSKCLKEKKGIDTKQIIPTVILDLSGSMYNSKSAVPALESTRSICEELFNSGFEKVLAILFGNNAICLELSSDNCSSKLSQYHMHSSYLPWDSNQTRPTEAFKRMHEYFSKNKFSQSFVIFLTDGEFNGMNDYQYQYEWKQICNDLSKLNMQFQLNSIGYQNDNLNNIKSMKKSFDSVNIPFTYKTIVNSSEIEKTMKECLLDLNLESIDRVCFDDQVLLEGDDIYSSKRYFDKLEPIDVLKQNTENKGVSQEWIMDVIDFEISLGLMRTRAMKKLKDATGLLKNQTEEYRKIFGDLVPYYNNIQKRYMELRTQYRSIKSRDIPVWKSLLDEIDDFNKLMRDVQSLISEQLNEKRSFEISTKITNSVSSRHLRTLQRRKVYNEQQHGKQNTVNIKVISEEPLKLECEFESGKILRRDLTSSLKELNSVYTCMYTIDQWDTMLNTVIGIPIQYKWKETDDWSPAKSFIEDISSSNFISMEGYREMQSIFGNILTPEHQLLYGNQKYVKSEHDQVNALIPVATDPFFLEKVSMVKERLGHMVAGSSLTFSNRHILFYVAVLRQCFNQLLSNNTEKMRGITLLLLNTFRLLTDKMNTIFDKAQKPLSKWEILVENSKR